MAMKPSMLIANKLKEFRKKNDLSQQRLADLSGVPFRTIQSIETGHTNTNIETLSMLDDAGVPVAELFNKTLTFSDAQRLLEAYSTAPIEVREAIQALLELGPGDIEQAKDLLAELRSKGQQSAK